MGSPLAWLVAPVLAAAAVGGVLDACSSPASLAGTGEACFQVTDCIEGLVCAPAPPSCTAGKNVCTSDQTCVQTVETLDAGMTDTGAAPPADGPVPPGDTGGGSETGKDTGAKDTAPPKDAPLDTSSPPDTSAPPDTTSPPDTNPPPDTSPADAGGD